MPDTTPDRPADRRTTWPTAAPLQQAADLRRADGDPLLADWLDATANALAWLAPYRDNEPGYGMWEAALAVARQLLGTTGEDTAAEEREPIQLRWGLDDVMYGDDDTTTVLLSGPGREPYWVELDPERTAALRDALAGPEGAVPPAPADRSATRDRIRRAICEASGFTWLPDELMEPDEYGEHADAVLAVLAGEAAAGAHQTEQAQPTKTQWAVEIYDPRHSMWVGGPRFHAPEVAVDARAAYEKNTPMWTDGSPVQRRIVREETTYTVEPATPAVPAAPEETR
ncbi:hypothetical protein [Streptomyces sp. EN16]|uniref:hypothetical protein n=1 Tax=Streptomyces sp. EN16 TaxID=212773 RepID=UPI0008515CE3|nr:hypothetical protein [Streptomyces sp. EN16]